MKIVKIKSCPVCGGENIWTHGEGVGCKKCGVEVNRGETSATRIWNNLHVKGVRRRYVWCGCKVKKWELGFESNWCPKCTKPYSPNVCKAYEKSYKKWGDYEDPVESVEYGDSVDVFVWRS